MDVVEILFGIVRLYSSFQYASIFSRERPLVSGINFQVIHKAGEQHKANVQNVQDGPSSVSNTGVSWPTRKLPIQSDSVARATALPLTAFGKISLTTTQQTGPKENAKQAIKARMEMRIHGPEVTSKANKAPIMINEKTAPPIPANNSGLLPHLSMVKIAMKVKTTFTSPIVT